jgi:REP element-mobilizing transposase RayT
VVMPNHVHIVLKPHEKLSEVLRWMKTAQELASVIAYVEENP